MLETIPGTCLPVKQGSESQFAEVLFPVFAVTNGLTLAQVTEITGLEPSTIQNWVKRGWVANPKGKRYSEQQMLRIILINILRGSMKLEQIADLMTYINGNVEDEGDDIISERELLTMLEHTIRRCVADKDLSQVEACVRAELEQYHGPTNDAGDRLFNGLHIMTLAYLSSMVRSWCEEKINHVFNSLHPAEPHGSASG